MQSPRRSLIVPVYRNTATITALLDAVEQLHLELGGDLELVAVVDGSPDDCYERLRAELPSRPFASQLIRHARNFGAIAAVRTGLQACKGDHFAVMAADLQEPIALVRDFFRTLDSGETSLVIGRRTSRDDPAGSRWAAERFWRAYRRIVQPDMPVGGIDVFGGTRAVRDALVALREANSSIVAQLVWLGFERTEVPYHRQARGDDEGSGWTIRKKIRYMLDSIYGFSALPIHLVTFIGMIGTITCLAAAIYIVIGRITGATDVRGYTPLMLTILGCTSLLLTALGVVGNYVWRAFENSKQRPLSVIDRTERFP